ncbi:MAG: GyrI-like domain-containing protein [Candidatus Helarchaeales archaeon]
MPKLIGELMKEIFAPDNQKQMVRITGPIMFLAHDLEYKEVDADIEIAIPIAGRITIHSDEVEVKNLPKSKVISITQAGPYDEIGSAYTIAFDHAIKNGFKIAPPIRELYLNDPNQVPEAEILTEIQIPIELESPQEEK